MSMMKPDEMQIVKCVSMKVSDNIALLVTWQYHTEKTDQGKVDRDKSTYRWLARVEKIEDIKKRIADMKSDAKRLEPWTWPDDPSWKGKIFTKDSTNAVGASWLETKLKKLEDWESGLKHLNGFKKCLNDYKPSAKYELEGYLDPDGNEVSLTDREALLKLVGKNLYKPVLKKERKGKSASKTEEVAAA